MQLHFRIHYKTTWGQHVAVQTSLPGHDRFRLEPAADGWWEGTLTLANAPKTIHYHYLIENDFGGVVQKEFGADRQFKLGKEERVVLEDAWRSAQHPDNALQASAFTAVIFKPQREVKAPNARKAAGKVKVRFQLNNVRVRPNQQVGIVGNLPELGDWDPSQALILGNTDYPIWRATIAAYPWQTIEYKYVLIDTTGKRQPYWDQGANRKLILPAEQDLVVRTDEYFNHPQGNWKGSGVAVPVFSLRTKNSLGCGEFTDLKLLVDWAEKVGMDMVQILPVNDTSATDTWVDSYPYAAISVFALHPLYLDVDALEKTINKAALNKQRKALHALPQVDYEATTRFKLAYARKVFEAVKEEVLTSRDFKRFLKTNAHWLPAYAAFCYLRDQNKTANFNQWSEHQVYNEKAIAKLAKAGHPAADTIQFHYYLQYHLDQQLNAAAEYARSKGIVLKGDIPIGIYRYSADAWVAPHLYNMNGQAGAPPDDFATAGQNWGFPTYDWEEMARDGYAWWKQRFTQLSRYFDAFRIDHILGFFRIWQVPLSQVEGIMGYFNPALPIQRDEFEQRGVPFDQERFCEPYITQDYLNYLFGDEAAKVAAHYLEHRWGDRYQLKPGWQTQREIRENLSEDQRHLEKGLFALVHNVLLFEVEGSNGTQFHPRIELFKTQSYQELDGHAQWQFKELHDDYFYHRQEDFWREQGMTKLPAMKEATDMLICGEDLGMVPACVPEVMKELGILSLEIQRMSKNPETEFLQRWDIPYWSVCSPSTHDMSPIRLWWEEEDPGRRQRFYNQELGMPGPAPDTCSAELAEAIIAQHLYWPTMWAVFPLQDLLAIDADIRHPNPEDERINVPAIAQYYWRYRFHLSVEDLLAADAFNGKLQQMLRASGR